MEAYSYIHTQSAEYWMKVSTLSYIIIDCIKAYCLVIWYCYHRHIWNSFMLPNHFNALNGILSRIKHTLTCGQKMFLNPIPNWIYLDLLTSFLSTVYLIRNLSNWKHRPRVIFFISVISIDEKLGVFIWWQKRFKMQN